MAGVKYVQEGVSIDYTPGSAVESGDVVVSNALVGVARQDIPANALGSLAVDGVFDFPKATSGGSAIAFGANCYWDDTNDRATTVSTDNTFLGKCVRAAADADATVRIRMAQ